LNLIQFENKIELIDLTSTKLVVETLTESKIECLKDEKDYFLYYLLVRYPGKSIIFVNSISCIKRLVPVLQLLQIPAWGIHAHLQQKQRLKNIERFMTEENSALVSTDVLARGIDIPYVDHVIHYQVPRTTEIYVHRSGRTARAKSEGISIILVDPDERPSFKNIAQVLNKENENNISQFPVDEKFMPQIRKRVNLAIQLNKLIHDKQKISFEKNWFVKKSEELDLPLDDDLLDVQDENDEIYKESKKK